MAEDSNSESENGASPFPSDAAAWAALSAASREKADAFLDEQKRLALEQTVLVRLQAKELEHELRLRHWSLRVRHLSDVLKLTFEVGLALIVVAAVAFVGATVWDAAHDHGVVVEAFQMPQDFTARGVTGEAIAGDLLAMLAKMQIETDSARPANTYQNNWSNDFKVQIADTGVSLGEINRYLHAWLGHQTHISGEVARTTDGIAVTVRVGDTRSTFEGPEKDRDALLQKAAEAVYAQTQPYRYGAWLVQRDRLDQAEAVYRALAKDPSGEEHVWADIGLMNVADFRGDQRGGLKWVKLALATDPGNPLARWDIEGEDIVLGHDEDLLAETRRALPLFQSPNREVTDRARLMMLHSDIETADQETADFAAIPGDAHIAQSLPDYFGQVEGSRESELVAFGALHDAQGLTRRERELPAPESDGERWGRMQGAGWAHFFAGDWPGALQALRRADAAAPGSGNVSLLPALVWPFEAAARFDLGDRAGAFALIAKTPLDCMWCTILRGRIDEMAGNRGGAAFWYADAVRKAPSIPFPYVYWGALLLRDGRYDAAIAKFKSAHDRGPHFADPLEMWGEALMQENRSDLALAKFTEANTYAPNWGRLHLKWGEALFYAGKRGDAQKQFAAAATLDLSPADNAALEHWKTIRD